MKNLSAIIGGSGQYGIVLANKLINKNKVVITTRSLNRTKKKIHNLNKIKIVKLDVLSKKIIKKFLLEFQPKEIFYFAGQSSPALSFKKPKETYMSNFIGCKNFLEVILEIKLDCKFINASSCEIFGNTNRSINVNTKKNPVSPYGKAKLKSFDLVRKFREKKKMLAYNAIIFNTESIFRERNFLIPKICLSAIKAKKYKTKTGFGNLNISREWNWCPEQCEKILKIIKKKPHDFILTNGKIFSALKMLEFAYNYFKLDYKNYIFFDKKFMRKKDINIIKSSPSKIKIKNVVYGKKLVNKLIKHYLSN